ncbi:MAG: hypothetical protein HC936_14460, partial [Leptolyngbyaceae cyanobacterium SU_3_3]|nr:hypothetical protein [Leptolyngbyaceae cyanobacterium SU_3_3]
MITKTCCPSPSRKDKPANVPGQRLPGTLHLHQQLRSIRCTRVVSWMPPIAPSTQLPTPYRSPHTTATTDRPLSALKHHRPSQTTVTTDNLLSAFGLTDNLQGQVESLCAEPANFPLQRRRVTFASPPRSSFRPLQGGCYAAGWFPLLLGSSLTLKA